jgi:alcohol dehydrogenase (quinone), cytochrome c subunit
MSTVLRFAGVVAGLGAAALLGVIFVPTAPTSPVKSLPSSYLPPDGAGERVAIAADCSACHTAQGGLPFAGGRAIESPFGVIYSTNITPDKQVGIGSYTLDEFRAVLYDGIRKDGTRLYPAMPYANYRKMTEEDVRALYGYVMKDVSPVAIAPLKTNLSFPFNQRWGVRAWAWAALPKAGFKPYLGDAKLDRGAYLVEALGHCGACHTPRNVIFAEKGYDSRSAAFLTGASLGSWPTADLRASSNATQRWSDGELVALLSTGRNTTKAIGGEMALVVEHSLQSLPKDDLDSIVAYLKHIRQERDGSARRALRGEPLATAALLSEASPQLGLGARLYLDNCNACHFVDGRGAPAVFPQLDRNDLVTAPSPDGIVAVILGGTSMPSTAQRPERLAMPDFGWRLSDAEVAALATFVRQSWSNDAADVSAAQVATVRRTLVGR